MATSYADKQASGKTSTQHNHFFHHQIQYKNNRMKKPQQQLITAV
jgi:hypothetical protein